MVFVAPSVSFADSSPHFTITEYFAKSCPHCVHMAPVWKTASHEASSDSEIGNKVEWVQKECYGDNWAPGIDFDYCRSKGVDAFPTIIMNENGSSNSWTASVAGDSVEAKAQSLLDFVRSHAARDDVKISALDVGSAILACVAQSATANIKFKNFM